VSLPEQSSSLDEFFFTAPALNQTLELKRTKKLRRLMADRREFKRA